MMVTADHGTHVDTGVLSPRATKKKCRIDDISRSEKRFTRMFLLLEARTHYTLLSSGLNDNIILTFSRVRVDLTVDKRSARARYLPPLRKRLAADAGLSGYGCHRVQQTRRSPTDSSGSSRFACGEPYHVVRARFSTRHDARSIPPLFSASGSSSSSSRD